MNNLEVIQELFKPYRYTKKGKVTIINTMNGDFVIKEAKQDINDIFAYLASRNFNNYPKLVNINNRSLYVSEYLSEFSIPLEQKALDMIKLVSNLHAKTTFFKEVSQDTFQKIYDDIDSNILYFKNKYNVYFDELFKKEFHSPSESLFMNNFTKLISSYDFCKLYLDKWFDLVKDDTKERVAFLHNNLALNHYIKTAEFDYLISWDNAKIDTPIWDIVNFYHNNYLDLNFEDIINTYIDRYPLNESEKMLLFLLIAMPLELDFEIDNEFLKVKDLRMKFDYIFKTDLLIKKIYLPE